MIQKNIIVEKLNINYYASDNLEKESPVVFLHGWQSDSLAFGKIFNKTYNFIAIDLPGFGRSDIPAGAWDMKKYAEFLNKFLEKLDIKNPILAGHSFGGRVIIKYNANYGNVKKNILIGSAGIKSQSKRIVFYKIGAKILKFIFLLPGLNLLKDKARKFLYKLIDSEDYINSGKLKETYKNVIGEDLQCDMKKIKVPTALIWGEDDRESNLESGKRMNKIIRGSSMSIIKNAGHYVFLDQPEEFNNIFLKETDVN